MKKIIALFFCINSLACYAQDSKSCMLVATYLIDNESDDLLCRSNGCIKEFLSSESQFKVAERKVWDKAPGLVNDVAFINNTEAVLIYEYDLLIGPGCNPKKIRLEKASSLDECMKYYTSNVESLKKENASNFKIIFKWEGKTKNKTTTLIQIADLDIEVTEYKNENGIIVCKMTFTNNNKINAARFYYQDEFGKERNIVIPPASEGATLAGRFKSGNMFKASFENYVESEPFNLIQYIKEKVYKFVTSDYFNIEEVTPKEKTPKRTSVHGIRG